MSHFSDTERHHPLTKRLVRGACLLLTFWFALAGCNLKGFECANDADCQDNQRCTSGWCTAFTEPVYPPIMQGTQLTCQPGKEQSCYDGPLSTNNQGTCRTGKRTCSIVGFWSQCRDQVLPQTELCGDKLDNNCNGTVDEGCTVRPCQPGQPCGGCRPGEQRPCYTGPKGTLDIGRACRSGTQTCGSDGTWRGCVNQVLPQSEVCDGIDNDCDGFLDEGCLSCTPNLQLGSLGVTIAARMGTLRLSSNGAWLAQSWNTKQSIHIWEANTLHLQNILGLKGHPTTNVRWMAFQPNSPTTLAIIRGQKVEFWDIKTNKLLQEVSFPAAAFDFTEVRFDPSGNRLLLLDKHGAPFLLELDGGSWERLAREDKVIAFTFSQTQDKLFLISNQLRRYDLITKKTDTLQWLTGSPDHIFHLKIKDGKWLVLWYRWSKIELREVETGKLINAISGLGVTSVKPAPDHRSLFLSHHSGELKQFGLETGSLSQAISTCSQLSEPIFDKSGNYVTAVCLDGRVWRWQWPSGQVEAKGLQVLQTHTDSILDLAFHPNNKMLASASLDGSVRLWQLSTQGVEVLPHPAGVTSVSFSSGGHRLLTGAKDGVVRLWELASKEVIRSYKHTDAILEARLTPDGGMVVASGEDGRLSLWKTSTGQRKQSWSTGGGVARGLQFQEQGTKLLAGLASGDVVIWELSSAKEQRRFSAHPKGILRMNFDEKRQRLLTISSDQTFKLWDFPTGQLLMLRQNGSQPTYDIAIRPNSQDLAVASTNELSLWPQAGTVPFKRWYAHQERMLRIVFSHDSRYLAAAGQDQVITLWTCPTP